jgi:dihydrofolate reductase
MRKVIASEMVSLDGFFEGPNGELDWHNVDEEFNQFAADQLDAMETILFGRVTYEGMASYWPTPAAIADDPIIAGQMNSMPKIVFSKTVDKVAEWSNSRLVKGEAVDEVRRLKKEPGGDMVIFGSGRLVAALTPAGLIDEYRIFVCPLILGSGRSMFDGVTELTHLELLKARTFDSGNVLLYYGPR